MIDYIVVTTDEKGKKEIDRLKRMLKDQSANINIEHHHFKKPRTGIIIVNGEDAYDVWKAMWKRVRGKIKIPLHINIRPWGRGF